MSGPTTTNQQPQLPRDARLIALLLAASGAEDAEEGVVRMLVEFAHRYTSEVLSDSLLYAEHAKGGSASGVVVPSLDDVRLAVQARKEASTVSKEFLLQLASTVNAVPLAPMSEVYGVRLPPPAHRLTAPNFTLAPRSSTTAYPPPGGAEGGAAGGEPGAGAEGDSEEGEGLFGDDDDDDDEDEDEDDDDEEMEDVTAGFAGANGANGEGGTKRGRDDEEEY